MKNLTTFVVALAGLSLSVTAPSLLAGGDTASGSSKNPIRSSGKEVVVVQQPSSGKEVVVESRSSGKEVVVDPSSGGTVAGRIFDDANGDGVKGADESYLVNIKVRLLQNSDDKVVAATMTDVQGIYVFKDIEGGQYRLEFDFGENEQIFSRPFAVNYDQPSIIVEPVPYFRGFDLSLVPPIKVHRILTPVELKGESVPPTSDQSPTSPFRP